MSRETYAATVDRIVDGEHVVLLLESDTEVVDELVVHREELSEATEGTRLRVTLEGGDPVEYQIREEETERRRRRLQERFDRLSDRLPESDDR